MSSTLQQPPESHVKATSDKNIFGFWVYLMTDCVLFSILFATFAVLRHSTNGGSTGQELFSLPFVLAETLILLTSSFVCGLGLIAVQQGKKQAALLAFAATFALGAAFLMLEVYEFHKLAAEGNSWRQSGFLSSFFALVGTHGLHITAGLLWLVTLCWHITRRGFSEVLRRRLAMFGLFWHFLDVVWIFIFSIVYLMGAL